MTYNGHDHVQSLQDEKAKMQGNRFPKDKFTLEDDGKDYIIKEIKTNSSFKADSISSTVVHPAILRQVGNGLGDISPFDNARSEYIKNRK